MLRVLQFESKLTTSLFLGPLIGRECRLCQRCSKVTQGAKANKMAKGKIEQKASYFMALGTKLTD